MAQLEQIYRFILLSELFKSKKKGVSYTEAIAYLQKKFDKKDLKLKFSEKTFMRDRDQIFKLLDMKSSYSRADKNFKVTEFEIDSQHENILDHILLIDAYRQTKANSEIILFEQRKAIGLDHLHSLLHAIQNRKIISFNYTKFWEALATKRIVEPYALKEFSGRWYLLANERNKGYFLLKTFGLDRISELEMHHSTFSKQSVKSGDIFKNSFGIISTFTEEPVKIILDFDAIQGKYIKTMPLHHSQNIISENDKILRIELNLVPTFDFIQQILSHGEEVEVISPNNLRQEVAEKIFRMKAKYSDLFST